MPNRTITIEARELEMIVELIEHRARSAKTGAVSSAHSIDAQDIRDLLQRHDASREPTEPTNGED